MTGPTQQALLSGGSGLVNPSTQKVRTKFLKKGLEIMEGMRVCTTPSRWRGGDCPLLRSQLLLKLERLNLEGWWRPRKNLLYVNLMILCQYLQGQMRSSLSYERLSCVYTPISQKVTDRFSYFFHYTTDTF